MNRPLSFSTMRKLLVLLHQANGCATGLSRQAHPYSGQQHSGGRRIVRASEEGVENGTI